MDYPKSVPSVGLVNGKFVDENPVTGTPGSLIPAAWGNGVTQEIVNAITAAGLAPNESQNNQLTLAIKELAKLDPQQNFPAQVYRKNLVINGGFDIWQRGVVNVGPNVGGFLADRFRCDWDGAAGVNISRQSFAPGQTDVPNEPRFFLRWQQVTTGSGSTTHKISQKIESVRTLAGKVATISFWVRGDAARRVTFSITQYFGNGGSVPATMSVNSFQVTNGWTKCQATFQVPSIAGKTLGAGDNDCLRIEFDLALNALQTIDVAQVQLEEGPVATLFERRPIGEELRLCQRYYEKTFNQDVVPGDSTSSSAGSLISIVMQGQVASSGQPATQWSFKVEKRAIPSTTLYRAFGSGAPGQWRSGSDLVSSGNARTYTASTRSVWVDNTDVGVVTQSYYIHAAADAEL
ncbi:carbohydrate-binding protein CenC [uncultured Pseudomonas sp.]|uniref:carbohydrate-binding protein CenC n=1 Tax=uncultured Pseudomonas sp. TaxID=114707 RepID=UPI0025F027D0|nr:carbohydrate-binding protein CenC [uncultured Pseudomonas sp.]